VTELEGAAAQLERIAPGYLDRIRARVAALAVPRTPQEQVRRSVQLVLDTAQINPNAPLVSDRRSGRFVKRVIGSLTRFYILAITRQVTELGESTSWMGAALYDYVAGLEAELADLRERVRCLEEAGGRS